MRDTGTWVIPTFNYELRTAKPVMLYWLQRASYAAFGVSEWSARLPSVLAGWLTVLLTYELARRMFGRPTGLLAGVVLASAFEFCMLAARRHPDATLLLFTVLTYSCSGRGTRTAAASGGCRRRRRAGWRCSRRGRSALALPGLVIFAVLRLEPRTAAAFSTTKSSGRCWCSCWWPGRGTGW